MTPDAVSAIIKARRHFIDGGDDEMGEALACVLDEIGGLRMAAAIHDRGVAKLQADNERLRRIEELVRDLGSRPTKDAEWIKRRLRVAVAALDAGTDPEPLRGPETCLFCHGYGHHAKGCKAAGTDPNPPEHFYRRAIIDGWYWSTCTCGWRQGPFPGEIEATDEFEDHHRDMRRAGTDPNPEPPTKPQLSHGFDQESMAFDMAMTGNVYRRVGYSADKCAWCGDENPTGMKLRDPGRPAGRLCQLCTEQTRPVEEQRGNET